MSLAPIPQSQQDRLRHIELRLRFLGEVRRPDVMLRFGIQSAAASRDLARIFHACSQRRAQRGIAARI